MRLLVVTQAVDLDDPVLGFFHGWLLAFASRVESVQVICLREGRHALPPNVQVYSLGKERGTNRLRQLVRLVVYSWKFRHTYDTVFCHMAPVFVLVGAPVWKLFRKPIALWYVHKHVDTKLRIAEKLASVVLTSSRESFRIESAKRKFLRQAVDTDLFARPETLPRNISSTFRLVSVGRLTPIKNLHILIPAIALLKDEGINVHLRLVGEAATESDKGYERTLRELVNTLNLSGAVTFVGSIPNTAVREEYWASNLSINASPTGGMDKAVLESMAAGTPALVANTAFTPLLAEFEDRLLVEECTPENLARAVRDFLMSNDQLAIAEVLEERVRKTYTLNALIEQIIHILMQLEATNTHLAYFMNMRFPTEKAHAVQVMRMCEAFAGKGVRTHLYVSNRRTSITGNPYTYYGVKPTFTISRLFSLDLVRYGALGFYIQAGTFLISSTWILFWTRPAMVYTRDAWIACIARILLIKRIGWEIHTAQPALVCRIGGSTSTRVIAISAGLKDYLIKVGVNPAKIHIEHDGADLDEFAQAPSREEARTIVHIPSQKHVVGYVGKLTSMGEEKGVREIAQAVGRLKKELPNIYMLIVGIDERERAGADRMVRDAGLTDDDVALVSHVSRAVIPLYLRASSVLVMNYPNTPHYAHMMSPLKLFEYMASGTPIVSSNLPSIREVLDEENAILVAPDDVHALEEGIREALTGTARGARRAERAVENVRHYTWSNRAGRILEELHANLKP